MRNDEKIYQYYYDRFRRSIIHPAGRLLGKQKYARHPAHSDTFGEAYLSPRSGSLINDVLATKYSINWIFYNVPPGHLSGEVCSFYLCPLQLCLPYLLYSKTSSVVAWN